MFFILPDDRYLAFIPRTGSTAWAQAILDKHYPGRGGDGTPQALVPKTATPPDDGRFYGVLRNPIERFCSGYPIAAKARCIDEVISDLFSSKPVDVHIARLTKRFAGYLDRIRWYRYEDQLAELAAEIGLDGVPPRSNVSASKPVLTNDQTKKLWVYYHADFSLSPTRTPQPTAAGTPSAPMPTSGPGTELKKLFASFGFHPGPRCSCNARAAEMDRWGPDVCEQKIPDILAWLRQSWKQIYPRLPFIEPAARYAVERAIKTAREKAGAVKDGLV